MSTTSLDELALRSIFLDPFLDDDDALESLLPRRDSCFGSIMVASSSVMGSMGATASMPDLAPVAAPSVDVGREVASDVASDVSPDVTPDVASDVSPETAPLSIPPSVPADSVLVGLTVPDFVLP